VADSEQSLPIAGAIAATLSAAANADGTKNRRCILPPCASPFPTWSAESMTDHLQFEIMSEFRPALQIA
jgi:hypothetical protein